MKAFTKAVKNISELTEINNHGEALQFALTWFCMFDELIICEDINERHSKKGYMDSNDYSERSALLKTLLAQAEKELTKAQYKKLHSAF